MTFLVAGWMLFMPAQCDQDTFARTNPQLCYPQGPFGQLPGNGIRGDKPNGGGIIGRILHGISGGLL